MPVSSFRCTGTGPRRPMRTGSASDRLNIFDAMYGRRQVVAKRIFFLAAKYAHQDENAAPDSSFAQRDAFVGGSDTEPRRAFGLQCQCASFRAVSVGIALHDCTNGDTGTDMMLQDAKIVSQRRQRNFSPIGTRGSAVGCQHGRQSSMITRFKTGFRWARLSD